MKKYLLIIAILAFAVLVSGCISQNTVKVVGDNIQVLNHTITNNDKSNLNSSSGNPTVSGTIKNNGSSKLAYVPVIVNFYNSKGEIVYSGSDAVVDLGPGEEKSFQVEQYIDNTLKSSADVLSDEENDKLNSRWPDHYEIIAGDPKSNVTSDFFYKVLQPIANAYNTSKGAESNNITIKGKAIHASSPSIYHTGTENKFSIDTQATIFMTIDDGKEQVGQWQIRSTGEIIPGYRLYTDVAAISWPDMKLVGWHRIYGSEPKSTVEIDSYDSSVFGSSPDIQEWIDSLPKG